MGYAEGYSSGANAFAAGTRAGLETGRLITEAGERIADGIEKTRALLLRREQEKDADRRSPEIEARVKELRQPYLMKVAELQATQREERLSPGTVTKEKKRLLVEEVVTSRLEMNDQVFQYLMGVVADKNPVLAERFKTRTSAAHEAWANDSAAMEEWSKQLGEQEYREGQLDVERGRLGEEQKRTGIMEHEAESKRIEALAERKSAEAKSREDQNLAASRAMGAWTDAMELASQEWDLMSPDDQESWLTRARQKYGEHVTLADVKKSAVEGRAKDWMKQAGFELPAQVSLGIPVQAPTKPKGEEAPTHGGAYRFGRALGSGLSAAATAPDKIREGYFHFLEGLFGVEEK